MTPSETLELETTRVESDINRRFIRVQTFVLLFCLCALTTVGSVGVGFAVAIYSGLSKSKTFTSDVSPADVSAMVLDVRSLVESQHEGFRKDIARMDQELRENDSLHKLLIAAVNASTDCMVAVDRNGVVIAWSSGATRKFGLKASQAIGFGLAFLIHPDMREQHLTAFKSAMLENDTTTVVELNFQCDAIHADGTRMPANVKTWYVSGVGGITRMMFDT